MHVWDTCLRWPSLATVIAITSLSGCTLLPGLDASGDSEGQGAITHACYYPRDCAADGTETCVLTQSGNRCMSLTEATYEVEPVATSLERFIQTTDHDSETLDRLANDLPEAPSDISLQSYRHIAENMLKPLVLRDRVGLQEVQAFIDRGSAQPDAAPSPGYKYEAYRALYAAKYNQNKKLKAALGRLFNFMPDKPLFTRHDDGTAGVSMLEDCGLTLKSHPFSGTTHASDSNVHACLEALDRLSVLMKDAMALSEYPLWPTNFKERLDQERMLVRYALATGINPKGAEGINRMHTLRHRIDSLFASVQADYVLLIQLLDEALRGFGIVEMPISITPIHPDTPPESYEVNDAFTFTLGQWASGEWYAIRQAQQNMPADEDIPLEPWQRYFEGAFKQAVAQSMAINEFLYQKLHFQGGYSDADTWKLTPFIEATGILHMPEYAAFSGIHQQLLLQIQNELDVAQRQMWSDLGLCALGIVGGAAAGFALGAPMAGAKVGGAVLCSISAYHGIQEAQALAQVLGNLQTLAFFGMKSAYASILTLDDITNRFKWSVFFVGLDVMGASIDVTDISRGVPELLDALEHTAPKAVSRLAQAWEQSYARHLLHGGPLQMAPMASELTEHGAELIRLSSNGANATVMIRDPGLRGDIREFIKEWARSETPDYWDQIPLSAGHLYRDIWKASDDLSAMQLRKIMIQARYELGDYKFLMTQSGFYSFPEAFGAANDILHQHQLPNVLDTFTQDLANGVSREDLYLRRVFRDGSGTPIFLHNYYPNHYVGLYVDPVIPTAGWTALADVTNELRALARTNPHPSEAVMDLLAEYAYVASGLLPFPRINWGLFYQVMLQAYQIFGLNPRYSTGLDHFMWAAPTLDAAKRIFRVWHSGVMDRSIYLEARRFFRY